MHLHCIGVLAGCNALLIEAQALLHLLPQLLPKSVGARQLSEAVNPAGKATALYSSDLLISLKGPPVSVSVPCYLHPIPSQHIKAGSAR